MSEPDGRDDIDLLRGFLSARDAVCPSCGYNLRGTTSGTCPECARTLELGLHRTDTFGGRRGLLALVLLVLFLVGGMNVYRAGRSIHQTVTGPTGQFAFVTQLLTTVNAATDSLANLGMIDLEGDAAFVVDHTAEVEAVIAAPVHSIVVRDLTTDLTDSAAPGLLVVRIAPNPSASTGLRWSSVGWLQWSAAVGWSILALAAAAALVVIAIGVRRPAARWPATIAQVVAVAGLACFLAFRVVDFIREMI